MVCTKCGAVVPDGWPSCLDCGTPASEAPTAQAPGADVFPLLASANLSRIRGNYADAQGKCTEILRLHPNNAPAHSLLGEVYEDQGRYQDAIMWYQLALEIDPSNETDRKLLQRANERLSATGRVSQAGAAARQTRQLRALWVSSPKMVWLGLTCLAAVCVALAWFLITALRSPSSHVGSSRSGPSASAADTYSSGGGTGTGSAAQDDVAGGSQGVPQASPPSAQGETPDEISLQQTINAADHPGIPAYTATGVSSDPRNQGAYAFITVSLAQPLAPAGARTALVQVAASAAMAAGALRLDRVTVRILGSTGSAAPTILFIGDISPGSFSGASPAALTAADAGRFQNAWWNSQVPS